MRHMDRRPSGAGELRVMREWRKMRRALRAALGTVAASGGWRRIARPGATRRMNGTRGAGERHPVPARRAASGAPGTGSTRTRSGSGRAAGRGAAHRGARRAGARGARSGRGGGRSARRWCRVVLAGCPAGPDPRARRCQCGRYGGRPEVAGRTRRCSRAGADPAGADWVLVGCVVAPAFGFAGFEMAPAGWRGSNGPT